MTLSSLKHTVTLGDLLFINDALLDLSTYPIEGWHSISKNIKLITPIIEATHKRKGKLRDKFGKRDGAGNLLFLNPEKTVIDTTPENKIKLDAAWEKLKNEKTEIAFYLVTPSELSTVLPPAIVMPLLDLIIVDTK